MNKRIRINGNLYEAVSPSFNSKPDSREELADSIDALVSVLKDSSVKKNCGLSGLAGGLAAKSTNLLEQLSSLLRG